MRRSPAFCRTNSREFSARFFMSKIEILVNVVRTSQGEFYFLPLNVYSFGAQFAGFPFFHPFVRDFFRELVRSPLRSPFFRFFLFSGYRRFFFFFSTLRPFFHPNRSDVPFSGKLRFPAGQIPIAESPPVETASCFSLFISREPFFLFAMRFGFLPSDSLLAVRIFFS